MFGLRKKHPAKEPMIVACSADESYAMGLAVTVRSLLEQNTNRPIILYVLDGGITPATKRKLLDSWTVGQAIFRFITPDPQRIGHLTLHGNRHVAQYFRLLIPSLLPAHHAKVLYLDCDLVIHRDLSDLWNTDLGDAPLAAVRDFGVPVVSSEPWGLADYRALNIAADEPYFSAGVMLLNLPVWRRGKIAEQVIRFTEEHRATVRLWEQDGLNALLHGRWNRLDDRWNVVLGALQTFDWWRPTEEQKPMLRHLQTDPWITHFASTKSWMNGCTNGEKGRFFAVLDRTAWKGWRPE